MTTEYKDVLRVEGVEATLEITTLRNKQVGFATDNQHRMLRKDAAGNPDYWTADGYDVTYNNISIGKYLYHKDDLTTYLGYTTGAFEIVAGGHTYIGNVLGILLLDEEVKIGEYVLPYTGGNFGQVLGLIGNDIVGWVDSIQGYTGMRISDRGALQVLCKNDTGDILTQGYTVTYKTDTYANGIDIAPGACENVLGISDTALAYDGDDVWVTVQGITDVRFDQNNEPELSGKLIGMSDNFSGTANDGQCMARSNNLLSAGYTLAASYGVARIAPCVITGFPSGRQGYVQLGVLGVESDTWTCHYVKTGGLVHISLSPQEFTSTDNFFKISMPTYLQPSNLTTTTSPACAYAWYDSVGVKVSGEIVLEYDSSDQCFHIEHWDSGASVSWSNTGVRGTYRFINFSYLTNPAS